MHGIGNDYVYVNGFEESVDEPAAVAVAVSDRHFGIGADGLILILPSKTADVRMRMFNADGSEGEMCGNGIRCVAKFSFDHGLSAANPMRIETGRGVLSVALEIQNQKVEQVTVDMGEPILELAAIPVDAGQVQVDSPHVYHFDVPDFGSIQGTFVSMGNPHVVVYVPDIRSIELEKIGPLIERHPAFPRRINVHFVQVVRPDEVVMRTWERGSGITLACGTGACAVCVAGVLTGNTERALLAHLPGGDLRLSWSEDGQVRMTGPAREVYSGDWSR